MNFKLENTIFNYIGVLQTLHGNMIPYRMPTYPPAFHKDLYVKLLEKDIRVCQQNLGKMDVNESELT